NDTDMARLVGFMGFEEAGSFRDTLFHHLRRVAHHYQVLFESADQDETGVWGFSADAPSDEMSRILAEAGFADAASVYATCRRRNGGFCCGRCDLFWPVPQASCAWSASAPWSTASGFRLRSQRFDFR